MARRWFTLRASWWPRGIIARIKVWWWLRRCERILHREIERLDKKRHRDRSVNPGTRIQLGDS